MSSSDSGSAAGSDVFPSASGSLCAEGFLHPSGFTAVLDRCGTPEATRRRYGLDRARGIYLAALAYGEGLYTAPDWASACQRPGHRLSLGRFVRANWYVAIRRILLAKARTMHEAASAHTRMPPFRQAWRALANSALPEKALACAAGLGWLGRSQLLMAGEAGPAVVLGILVMAVDPRECGISDIMAAETRILAPVCGAHCGSCRLCVDACPTGALHSDGSWTRELCLQHWSTIPGTFPDTIAAAWGRRLYGCDICTIVCPQRRSMDAGMTDPPGQLGASLPAAFFLDNTGETITSALAGTALHQSWIPPGALIRNARLSME